MKNIVIVAHKYLPQPDDDLVHYLNSKKTGNVLHIKHSFPDAKDRRSFYTWYFKGKKTKKEKTIDYKFLPEVVIYLKELFFTIKWPILSKTRWDLYIGMDGLCTFFGLILRKIGVCKKVVYWNIDFVPQNRFKKGWKNSIYHTINIWGCKKADEVWDLSTRMIEGRKKYLGFDKKSYKLHRLVPYGLWISRIKKYSYKDCEKDTLVFMGHLLPKQGVDMVVRMIPEILKQIPNFKFKIIGGGNYRNRLIKIAKELSVEKHCYFMGRIEKNTDLESEIAKSCVAIAPYLKTSDSYTYFTDPGKVKTYLACGVPVLLTDLPWNAKEIEEKKCGIMISDDGSNLVEKLMFLLKPNINKKFRKNAIKYSKRFDYQSIFSKLGL
jgi:glycosyltransferase involved in cell wall biosynthesis